MKKEQLYEAIGEIKDSYIQEAREPLKTHPSPWIKWGAIAASLCVIVTVACFALYPGLWTRNSPTTEPIDITEETAFGSRYVYRVDSEPYYAYSSGKVIDAEQIGDKITDVTVTAGWITNPTHEPREEHLRGEIYAIRNISPDVAVALRFLDRGDAVTTTHYYVLLNLKADLSSLQDYIIPEYHSDPTKE